MNPYLPFATIPVAAFTALFVAGQWSVNDPVRFRVPPVSQLEEPDVPTVTNHRLEGNTNIRVAAFLPHQPPRASKPAPALILHSVMTGNDLNLATINGQLVREGDKVEGYVVRRITADGVDLAFGGQIRRLPMRPLHELPPPVEPGLDPAHKNAPAGHSQEDLNKNFWATFNSPQT